MRKNELKSKVSAYLSDYFYYSSGYKNVNGGFAEYEIKQMDIIKNNDEIWIRVSGILKSGVDDMGNGCSVLYKNSTTEYVKYSNDMCSFIDKANLEEIKEAIELKFD